MKNPLSDLRLDTLSFLSVIGVSHHTCPVEVREKFALTSKHTISLCDDSYSETVWLSTCNRTEMYSVFGEAGAAEAAFANTLGIPSELANRCAFKLEGAEAARHLFRVASGLESLVVGEDEILGQVRRALANARESGSAGPALSRMFQDALAAGKRVRSETEINRFPASVSAAAASIVRERRGGSLENSSVLVIGAGDMGRAVARCLKGMKTRELAVANRTFSRAEELARDTGAEALAWPVSPESLSTFDAVISCTSAPGFILTRDVVESAVEYTRPGKSICLVDIAVPRDIDPGVGSIPRARLSNIDDARSVVDDSVSKRSLYVEPAERIISDQLDGFMEWMDARRVSDGIRLMRERADSIRLSELDWAMPKLAGLSQSEREIVEQFSTRLVNKLLHAPTLRLRESAAHGDAESAGEFVRHIFDLEFGAESNGSDGAPERAERVR